jgi:hypothetical protein
MKCERVCLSLLLIFFCFGAIAAADEPNSVSGHGWKTLLSYNNWSDENPSIMRTSDGYLVAGKSHYMAGKTFQSKVVLWKLDNKGTELWVKDINLITGQTGKPFSAERCFSLPDEKILLLVSASNIKAWLLRFDDAGSITFSKELPSRLAFDIQGLAKAKDGLFLYGSEHKGNGNSDACVTKITLDGDEIWRKEYDKGKMEWGMGLAPLKDGGFIFSADSGSYNKFGGGPSEAWIVKCDRDGNILKEITFDNGRHPTVTVSDDIAAVVFNKENFPQQDISVLGLDSGLKTVWRIDSLFGKTGGLGMLTTIVDKQGNFILAGSKFDSTSIWKISKKGKIHEEIEIKDAEHCVRFDSLLQTPGGYIVAGFTSKMSEMPRTPDGQRDKDVQWDNMDILVVEVADPAK